jgi:hypothetical protein
MTTKIRIYMTTVFAKVHEKGKKYKGFFFQEKAHLLVCYTYWETLHYCTYLKHQPRKNHQKNFTFSNIPQVVNCTFLLLKNRMYQIQL